MVTGHIDEDVDIVAAPLEHRVVVNADDQVQIARLALRRIGRIFALAGDFDPRAGVDAGRDGDFEPRAAGSLDRTGGASEGFAQRDGEVVLDIASTHRRLACLAGLRALMGAEEVAEDVADVAGVAELLAEIEVDAARLPADVLSAEGLTAAESAKASESTALALHLLELFGVLPLVAPLVVGLALLGIGEDIVGGVDFLEAGFGVAVAAGHVGVVLAGELAVGGSDVALGGVARYTENLVEILSHAGASLSAADCIIADLMDG